MRRPVLLGGSNGLQMRSSLGWFLWVWLPVGIAVMVIARESTDAFSSAHTSVWLRHIVEAIRGPLSDLRWETTHHHIRKTGHFMGYGFAGLAWVRAWLLTWRAPLRRRATALWRGLAVLMGILCTMLIAVLDELHQSYLPSRTGLVSDALLDTAGALTLVLLAASFWIFRADHDGSLRHSDS